MTRGRDANMAYVALDEPGTDHTPSIDKHVTARGILSGVLQHSGVELSAHQTRTAEHDKWTGIAQLAAEYDTIASIAQRDRWTALALRTFVTDGRLTLTEARTATESDSFWSLCAELRRTEAAGNDAHATLARVVRQRTLLDADDACAVVMTRLTRDGRRGVRPSRRPAPLIAGLIPPALGPMPDDARHALDERARLIEERATALARAAVHGRAAWVQRTGLPTTGNSSKATPPELVTVAAYRHRHGIKGSDPLGRATNDPRHGRDRDTARAAISNAGRTAQLVSPPRATSVPSPPISL